MDHSEEWGMVIKLMEFINEIDSDRAAEFVENLYEHLDPYTPFEDVVEGNQESVEKQRKWLYSLYEKYVNKDPEAAQEVYEDWEE